MTTNDRRSGESRDDFVSRLNLILEQHTYNISQLEDLLEERTQLPDIERQNRWKRVQISEFYSSNLELIDYCIDLIEVLGKQSSLIGAETELIGLDDGWRQIKKTAIRMHNRVALLNPPTKQDFVLALRWAAAKGEENDLVLLEKVQNALPFKSDDIENLLDSAKESISKRLVLRKKSEWTKLSETSNGSFQDVSFSEKQDHRYLHDVSTHRMHQLGSVKRNLWKKVDRIAIATIGGISLGTAVAQLPGAIIFGLFAVCFSTWYVCSPKQRSS